MGNWMKKTALAVAGGGLLTLAVILVRGQLEAPAPVDPSPLLAKAGDYNVSIRRDHFGVPHIYGPRDADVAFGIAFAHAEDDFATIQEVAIATRGNLAEIKGADAAVTDYLVRFLGIWDLLDAQYETRLSSEVRAVLEAYADGVNYYAALNPHEMAVNFTPLTGKDVAAGFVFKTPFFYGLDNQLKVLFGPERTGHISKGPQDAFLLTDKPPYPIGSNGVAVAPSRSADGVTRLLVNSHQPYAGPVAWYEARLKSEEGWNVAGGFFPGTPFMLHGHNANLGWANTVNKPDLIDVYVLTINPDDENQYLLDGEWRDFDIENVDIRVKLWGPFWWTVTREIVRSAHGPVLRQDHGVYAIRYAGMSEVRQAEQYFRINKARNFDEWQDAMRLHALPSINYIYADREGNIAYIYNGQIPKRVNGVDWQGFLPGDRSDLIWQSYEPYDALPQLINPPAGFVIDANSTPFKATDPNDDLRPSNYPATMGVETGMTNRAYRALELFGADPSITREEFRAYKFDVAYSDQSRLAELIDEVLAIDAQDDENLLKAQSILATWDRRTNIESRGAALGVLMGAPIVWAEMRGEEPPVLMDTLRSAMTTLLTYHGRLDPQWGDVNRIVRGDKDLPIDGGPDILRAVYGEEPEDDGKYTAVGGDTFIMFVEWGPDGQLRSESVHQFGSATMDEASPHYSDQTPLFVDMTTKPTLFDLDALEANLAEEYRPGERAAR